MNREYFTQPDGQGIVFLDEVGVGFPAPTRPLPRTMRPTTPTRRYSPIATRKIGASPGFWNDVKGWWAGLKPEYRTGLILGIGALGVVVAAVQGSKGKGGSVGKI